MDRKRITLLTGSLLLVLLGIVIGQIFFQSKPERVVLYENIEKESSPAFVHASYVSDDNSRLPSILDLNEAFVNIAENVNPSVVTIITTKVVKLRGNQMFPGFDDDLFYRFFGGVQVSGEICDMNNGRRNKKLLLIFFSTQV